MKCCTRTALVARAQLPPDSPRNGLCGWASSEVPLKDAHLARPAQASTANDLTGRIHHIRPLASENSPPVSRRRAVSGCSPRHVASASVSELDTTYLGSELIAVAMGLAGSV